MVWSTTEAVRTVAKGPFEPNTLITWTTDGKQLVTIAQDGGAQFWKKDEWKTGPGLADPAVTLVGSRVGSAQHNGFAGMSVGGRWLVKFGMTPGASQYAGRTRLEVRELTGKTTPVFRP